MLNNQIRFVVDHIKEMRKLARNYRAILEPAVKAGNKVADSRDDVLARFVFSSYAWYNQAQDGSLKLDDEDIQLIDDTIAVLTTMEAYHKQFKQDDLLNFVALNNAIGRAVTLL